MSISFFHVFDNDIQKVTVSAAAKKALRSQSQSLEMTTFSVGSGEAILLRRKQQVLLIDGGAGDEDENLDLGNFLANHLASEQLQLAAFIATHPHVDHLNAILPFLHRTGTSLLTPGATYYDNGENYDNSLKDTLIPHLKSASSGLIWKHVTQAGMNFTLGTDVQIKLFVNGPDKPKPPYKSIYMAVKFGDARFLFTGDSYIAYENVLLQSSHKTDLPAHVLKITHHGSKYGTGANFVTAVNPRIAVASCSKKKDHTLKPEVKQRLTKNRRCEVRDTNTEGGDVIVRTDGKSRTLGGNTGVLYEIQTTTPGAFPHPGDP